MVEKRLTVPKNDGQNSVMKEQDQRRHGIDGPLKRETACPRLVSDAFQPPYNFDPESRATPTTAPLFPRKFAQAFQTMQTRMLNKLAACTRLESFWYFAPDPPKEDHHFRRLEI